MILKSKQILNLALMLVGLNLIACANVGVEADASVSDIASAKTAVVDSSLANEVAVECPENATPALMIVEGDNDKPEQFKEYTKALIASNLYPALKGYYAAVGDPADIFEGQWPEKKFAVVARFPCLARAQQFWSSQTYQDLKPLRKGAGDVRVVVFEELQIPAYIDWNE